MLKKLPKLNIYTLIIYIPIVLLLLHIFSVPNVVRYRIENRFSDPITLLWADGVIVYEEGNHQEISRSYFDDFLPNDQDGSDTTAVTITDLYKPYLWMYGNLTNSADKLKVFLNGEEIKQVQLQYSDHAAFWETYYLNKSFGLRLPLSLCKYNFANEIVISSGNATETYYFYLK